jgi:hypothetical protein
MWANTFHLLQGFISCQGPIFIGGEGGKGCMGKAVEKLSVLEQWKSFSHSI